MRPILKNTVAKTSIIVMLRGCGEQFETIVVRYLFPTVIRYCIDTIADIGGSKTQFLLPELRGDLHHI
jgi:hypothetical protein